MDISAVPFTILSGAPPVSNVMGAFGDAKFASGEVISYARGVIITSRVGLFCIYLFLIV